MKIISLQKLKQFNKTLNTSGFSMAEVLVTVLIFSSLAAGLYSVAMVGESSWQTNKAQIEIQQELRKSASFMIPELLQAGDSSITNVRADNNWYDTIIFKKPTGILSGSVTWDAEETQYVLGGTGGTQLLRIQGADTRVISDHINSMQFRRQTATPNTLEVRLDAQNSTLQGRTLQMDLIFNIHLRNR